MTDGHTTIRAPLPGDAATLIAGRDAQFHRFMGEGSADPQPSACIIAAGHTIGWTDYDPELDWLGAGEVNLGYSVFAAHRGKGYASRAVQLLMHHLALTAVHNTAVLLIRKDNVASLALADRLGFARTGTMQDSISFKRPVPPLTYSDGVVTIRRRHVSDLDQDLAAKDDEQQRWLWQPDERQLWAAMDDAARRAHALKHLASNHEAFGSGPKWTFSVDAREADNVGYVDCDLANENLKLGGVAFGDANISYASHPGHRGRGYISRAVRLVLQFLAEHTGVLSAHLVIEPENQASLRVAHALDAVAVGKFRSMDGPELLHHKLAIDRFGRASGSVEGNQAP